MSSVTVKHIKEELGRTKIAHECLELAAVADAAGDVDLSRECLERAVALDRFCQAALLNLAALALNEDDTISAFSMLEEAARVAPLPTEVEPLREQLYAAASSVPELDHYLRLIGRTPVAAAETILSIIVITGGFPPDDVSDAARELSQLVSGLRARGHSVDVFSLGSSDSAQIASGLRACASWIDGKAKPLDGDERERRIQHNREWIDRVVTERTPSLVLAANLELLDISVLQPALDHRVPVLHLVRTARLSFTADEQPREAHYWIAPVSDWTGTALRNASYETARMESIHPATPLESFFRLFLPDTGNLRICFLATMRPASGAETLIQALAELKAQGIPFSAEFAGDTPDAAYVERITSLVRELGLEKSVRLRGPLASGDVPEFFGRHNIFVFAPQLPEPFGIQQVQAMASGLVVLSSGTGGSKEIIEDQLNGLLFAPGKAGELAGKLASLVQNPQLMAGLQRQAQKRATMFSTENAVTQVETLTAEMQAAIRADFSS